MANFSWNDPDLRAITIDGFGGGLNEWESPTHLVPNELAAVTNMDIRQGRTISSRRGQKTYVDQSYQPLYQGVSGMHRYLSSLGVGKILLSSGGKLWRDSDDGKFNYTISIAGDLRFHQFHDTVIVGSPGYGLFSYDPVGNTIVQPDMSGIAAVLLTATGDNAAIFQSPTTSGGFLSDSRFTWRVTMSVYHGESFLGETGACRMFSSFTGPTVLIYEYVATDWSGGANNDNKMDFRRGTDVEVSRIPSYVKYINFYRSPERIANPPYGYYATSDLDLYYVGSVSMDTVRAATVGDILFTDYGDIPLGKAIRKIAMRYPPKPTLMAFHKSRLWVDSPYVRQDSESGFTYHPDRTYYSTFESEVEPFVFYPESWIVTKAGFPGKSTGIVSYQNKALIKFYEDSMWAIVGADDELDFGIPNISIELISPDIGCVAPDSIQICDGLLVWRARNGIYAFDGTAPRPLQTHKIEKSLSLTPLNRIAKSASSYNHKKREYSLFTTIPDGTDAGSSYNRHAYRYSFNTGTWTHDKLLFGVARTLPVQDRDYLLWGIEDIGVSVLAANGVVTKADEGFVEGASTGTIPVTFSKQTAFLDDGRPFAEKSFLHMVLETNSPIPLHVDFLIDNKYDSRATGEGIDLPIPIPEGSDVLVWDEGNWDDQNWAGKLQGYASKSITRSGATIPTGKSISVIVSGENVYEPVEIHSLRVYYKEVGPKP